ncbi:MAG TPA: hypothetical protein VLY24_28165, partial [Bryobacteraceae bacterium]|nr:hypothetical protein [Bryobacteraceae bacterium]
LASYCVSVETCTAPVRILLRSDAGVPAVPYKELRGQDRGAGSAEMRQRVEAARGLQQRRGF